MSIKERKERERDEMRGLILDAASQVITAEGFDGLSIRKIADRIEYSPAIIYHYFQDKSDIINQLMQRDYQQIVSALASAEALTGAPEEKIRGAVRRYIDMSLGMPDKYMSIMLNSTPHILEHTSILFRGASGKRQALTMLCQSLSEIYKGADEDFIELTAQFIWAATFGLTIRLLIEKDIDEEQRQRLIEHHLKTIIEGVLAVRAPDKA